MAVYLATFSGTLLGGAEQFSHTLAIDDVNDGGDAAMLTKCVNGLAAMAGVAGFLAYFPDTTRWTNVKVARITNLGLGTLFAGVNQPVNHVGGMSTASAVPAPQSAVAISLVGGPRANGTPYRGRFYLPGQSYVANSTSAGQLIDARRDTLLAGAQALLQSINELVTGVSCQVWSRKDATTSTVTAVRCGLAIDTVRSRRRDIPEGYEQLAVSLT